MKTTIHFKLKGLISLLTLVLGGSLSFQAQCPSISAASASSPSLCEGQSTNLNASALGTGTISWYTSSTGGTYLGSSLSGANFAVSPLVSTTYYAEPLVISVLNFSYTGTVQEYTVPPGVNTITVDLAGAQGGTGQLGGSGGLGGRIVGTIAVTPGDVLKIYVGGTTNNTTGGYNGGGNGAGVGAGGGGASDIRLNGIALSDRIIVAGGGGAGNQGSGGDGGGLTGEGGSTVGEGIWATGGSQSAGGSGGIYYNGSCAPGSYAYSGSFGLGGDGVTGTGGCNIYGGSGGGGGYYGGGGMQINGAGGGSSYASNGTHTQGYQYGNGYVNLTVPVCTNLTRSAVPVTVYSNPVISVANGTMCAGDSFTLNPSGALTYTYEGGNAVVSPSSNTSYTITGSNAAGCVSQTYATANIVVQALPVVNVTLSSSTICLGESISLSASGADTYSWNTGSSSNSIQVSPSGNTSYTLFAYDTFGCLKTTVSSVTVNPLPVVAISGSNAICTGNSTTLTATGANSYTWNTGSSLSSVVLSPTASASYTVTGESTEGCLGTNTVAITVHSLPLVSITGTNAICMGNSATLTANGAVSYNWNTGSSNSSISVSPTSNTNYSLSGTSAEGCVGMASPFALTVYALPNTSISGNNVICEGQSTTLTATGANSYTWSTGPNTTQLVLSPTLSTVYTLIGMSNEGCLNSAVMNVTVNPLPQLSINGTFTLCNGGSTTLTASGADTYVWTDNSSNASLVVNPSTNTSYSVNGTNLFGCVDGAAVTVTVYALPLVSISGNATICAGNSSTLSANGADTYSWSSGSTNTSIVVSPLVNTSYSVIGTSLMGCSNTSSPILVTVNALPLTTISGTNALCAGDAVTLTASGASSYVWSDNSTQASIVVSPTANISYSVVGTSSDACVANAAHSLTVYALPLVGITAPNAICNGQSATLTASGANTYTWSTNSNALSIVVQPNTTTVYSLNATSTEGCFGNAALTLTVNENPILVISGTSTLCSGATASLLASGAASYNWTNGASNAFYSFTPLSSSVYTVTGTSTENCQSTATAAIIVYQLPQVLVNVTSGSICVGETATLTASGALTYVWSNGSNASSIQVSPLVTTQYSVTGSDAHQCSAIQSSELVVSVCSGLENITKAENSFKVYPNPNTGEFSVDLLAKEHSMIHILNMLGETIKTIPADNHTAIDLKDQAKGMYFVRVIENGQVLFNTMVIKQ